jgi:hypothetical protein
LNRYIADATPQVLLDDIEELVMREWGVPEAGGCTGQTQLLTLILKAPGFSKQEPKKCVISRFQFLAFYNSQLVPLHRGCPGGCFLHAYAVC